MKITLALAAALTALVLTGCSDDSSDKDNDDTAGDSGAPACDDVWVAGQELDLSTYEGCEQDGTVIAAVTGGCYDQKSLEYRGQFATNPDETLWVIQTGTDPKTGQGGEAGTIVAEDPAC